MYATTHSDEFLVSQLFNNIKGIHKFTPEQINQLDTSKISLLQKKELCLRISVFIRKEINSLQSDWKGWKYTAIKLVNWLISLLPHWFPKPKPLPYFPKLKKMNPIILNQVNNLMLILLTDRIGSNPKLIEELFLRLPKLTTLDFALCEQITDRSIKTIAPFCTKITSLNLNACTRITNFAIQAIAQYCRNITSLNLACCYLLTDFAIQAIAPSCVNLTTLNLCGCNHLTDNAIRTLLPYCGELTTLNLSGCNKLTIPAIQAIIKQKCSQLTTLNLSSLNITNASITSITSDCREIKSLNLSWCSELTDPAINSIVQNCQNLTSLDLGYCKKLTDASIQSIGEHYPELTSLNLTHCKNLTDASIQALAENCHHLTSLDLSWCNNVTDAAITALAERCTNPISIYFYGWENPLITLATIQRIHRDHPHVTIIKD